jgi:hypothetical protein
MFDKLLKHIKNWIYGKFPIYMYNENAGYVHKVQDVDDQTGKYTDVIVTNIKKFALNIRGLSKDEREDILEKVNKVMSLGNISFRLWSK